MTLLNSNLRGTAWQRLKRLALLAPAVLFGMFTASTDATAQNVSGTVFIDSSYSGGAGNNTGTAASGVRVEIWRATSQTGTYTYQRTGTTTAAGAYSLSVPRSTTNWFIVRVVAPTSGAAIAVQTFRSTVSGTAGVDDPNRVGGENPDSYDGANGSAAVTMNGSTYALSSGGYAESISAPFQATTNTNITGVDFGFNYDTIVNNNDTGQGSLRQFILNANALGGSHKSIFMLSDGLAHPGLRSGLTSQLTSGVAVITIASALPTITAGSVNLDGSTQTANIGDTNTSLLGSGGTVGTAGAVLSQFSGPEVEIASSFGSTQLVASGSGDTIQNIAFHQVGIDMEGSSGLAQNNIVGMHANGTITTTLTTQGITVGAASGIVVNHNYVKCDNTAIRRDGSGSSATIKYNEVDYPSGGQTNTFDGIILVGTGTGTNDTIQYNLVKNLRGGGIELGFNGGLTLVNTLIDNNTVYHNGYSGASASAEPMNIAAYQVNSGSTVTISHNVVTQSGGPGIVLMQAQGVKLSQNYFQANGVSSAVAPGIQLDANTRDPNAYNTAPGPTANTGTKACGTVPNCGMNYPVFSLATLDTSTNLLHLKGFVGSAAGQTAFANATIEIFKADNTPANQNGAIITGDGKNVAHGEGTVYVATFTADASGNFDVQLSGTGWSTTDLITATATDASYNTSEFAANIGITLATTVKGAVYADVNHNATKDASEDWAAGPATAIYVNLLQGSTVIQSKSVTGGTAGSGSFTFSDVVAGTYTIVVTNSASATTAAYPATFVPVSPANGVLPAFTIPATPAPVTGENIGLFKGSSISGTVFSDTGSPSGTANNGLKEAGETGLANSTVKVTDTTGNTTYDTATTDANGAYTLYVSSTVVTAVTVRRTAPTGYVATGGSQGTTGSTYTRATETVGNFTPTAGTLYTGVVFGVVPANTLSTTGAQQLQPGTTYYYPHTFVAGTAGSVTFTTAKVLNPTGQTGWAEAIILDANCNGTFDTGEVVITTAQAVTAGQTICVLMRETVPTPASGTDTVTLTPTFTYANNAALNVAGVVVPPTQTDTTTVVYLINGRVYIDANHNSTLDAGETGPGGAVYVKLVPQGSSTATQVVAADTSTGAYSFPVQVGGSYTVVMSIDNNPANIAPPSVGAFGFVGTENGAGTLAVTLSANQTVNFGGFAGSKLSGTVFTDNGSGSGTANNGAKDGTEAGLSGVTVTVTNIGNTTTYDTATTASDGNFTVWIPAAATAVVVRRASVAGYLATGGNPGTTASAGGVYSRSPETVAFTAAAGNIYTGVLFGDVQVNTLSGTYTSTVLAGNTKYYAHQFVANTYGNVTFTVSPSITPTQPAWTEAIVLDANCNGTFDAGETTITGVAQAMTAGQTLCVLFREALPSTAAGSDTATISAAFTYVNALPALSASLTAIDTTNAQSIPTVTLLKVVDKANAAPGDVLTYTITYSNTGYSNATNVKIQDDIPLTTSFVSAACGALPTGITSCSITAPAVGATTGTITWTLAGSLSGQTNGTLVLKLKVQ